MELMQEKLLLLLDFSEAPEQLNRSLFLRLVHHQAAGATGVAGLDLQGAFAEVKHRKGSPLFHVLSNS